VSAVELKPVCDVQNDGFALDLFTSTDHQFMHESIFLALLFYLIPWWLIALSLG